MKHQIIIALGSTHLPVAHIQWASQRLIHLFDDVQLSRCLWTQDIKGTGIWYMNRLAYATTTLPVDQLQALLKDIEAETGRTKQCITIDLDLMQYDSQRYHDKDWERPYIQKLKS